MEETGNQLHDEEQRPSPGDGLLLPDIHRFSVGGGMHEAGWSGMTSRAAVWMGSDRGGRQVASAPMRAP